ncbi:hypothetical protein QAD02_022221 [Eretmocerus hayati]|uniref:Uncharacterized protein n=1 Tax=Eretmocerus hayati TaxID=131215 RepID=A0ACC2PVP9_9HYME|nr:hypothetical protein QAD02_022221 [Eretmocerus hayati]
MPLLFYIRNETVTLYSYGGSEFKIIQLSSVDGNFLISRNVTVNYTSQKGEPTLFIPNGSRAFLFLEPKLEFEKGEFNIYVRKLGDGGSVSKAYKVTSKSKPRDCFESSAGYASYAKEQICINVPRVTY